MPKVEDICIKAQCILSWVEHEVEMMEIKIKNNNNSINVVEFYRPSGNKYLTVYTILNVLGH